MFEVIMGILVLLGTTLAFTGVILFAIFVAPAAWELLREGLQAVIDRTRPAPAIDWDARDAAAEQRFQEILAIGPEPDHQIQVWTPLEREVFGVNDTMRLIDNIQSAINAVEWSRMREQMEARKQREAARRQRAAAVDMPDLSTLRAVSTWHEEEEDFVRVFSAGNPTPVRTFGPPPTRIENGRR